MTPTAGMSEEMRMECLVHGTKCLHCGIACKTSFEQGRKEKYALIPGEIDTIDLLKKDLESEREKSAEIAELLEWKNGKKGIEDYYALKSDLESSRQEIEKWKAKAKIEESEVDRLGKEIESQKDLVKSHANLIITMRKAIEAERQSTRELIAGLEKIANGSFHIGNDEHGNVFGPPDSVMCRNIAKDLLSRHKAGGKA